MKRHIKLGAFIAIAAVAPSIALPRLAPKASAQPANAQPAEYPDVPTGHWAYDAINRLSQAGIIEGLPDGTYRGNKPLTRYEFAVAIARLLERIPGQQTIPDQTPLPTDLVRTNQIANFITRQEVNDLIAALRTEFADELARMGVRVGALEERVSNLENRVAAPSRQTLTPSVLHRTGFSNYIDAGGDGRSFITGGDNIGVAGGVDLDETVDVSAGSTNDGGNASAKKFSYTDLELRLTDRVTDRLTATGALRALGSTREDAWTGDSNGSVYVRELYAVADLSDRSFLSVKGLTAILGRQRTKFGQGLMYDNQLAPTDQVQAQFKLGPLRANAFVGSSNNQLVSAGSDGVDPYLGSGAVRFLGLGGGAGDPNGGSIVGFPGAGTGSFADDNESLVHASADIFRIGGQPVSLGASYEFDGVQSQKGYSFDLTLPIFGRTVGFEYAKNQQYANGEDGGGKAYLVTLPILRSNILDLNAAYGKADDDFEYFISSAANPFARTYGEALFDRPMFLGAPMAAEEGGGARFMAAKKGYDFNGTVRLPLPILRRIPLDFRYYSAQGTDDIDLGRVYSVGTTFNVTPGVDLELKYGRYDSDALTEAVKYYRIGANIGF